MANRLDQGIVLTLSAEALRLAPGPLRLLLRLRQLAGHSRRLATYTKSLATLFGVTTNTVRNWRNVLIQEGYIHWLTDERTGITTILIRIKVEPPSRRAQLAEPGPADPKELRTWWKYPTIPKRLGGAKSISPIKPRKILEPREVEALANKWGFSTI